MCRVNRGLNIPTPLPPRHPPWNSTPRFAPALSMKAIPRILSPSLGGASEMEMKIVQARSGCTGGGWADQSCVSVAPRGECSLLPGMTVPGQGALCALAGTGPVYSSSAQSRKFPVAASPRLQESSHRGSQASPTLAAAQCPWFLVGHLAPWDDFWPWLPLSCSSQPRTLPHHRSIFFVTSPGATFA